MSKHYKIAEVSEMVGFSKATLRYYEQEELVIPKRQENSYRFYTDSDILDLQYTGVMKYAHFSVKEMRLILNLKRQPVSENCNQDFLGFMQEKTKELERIICHYRQLIDLLQQLTMMNKFETAEVNQDTQKMMIETNQVISKLFTEIN